MEHEVLGNQNKLSDLKLQEYCLYCDFYYSIEDIWKKINVEVINLDALIVVTALGNFINILYFWTSLM